MKKSLKIDVIFDLLQHEVGNSDWKFVEKKLRVVAIGRFLNRIRWRLIKGGGEAVEGGEEEAGEEMEVVEEEGGRENRGGGRGKGGKIEVEEREKIEGEEGEEM